MHFLALVILSLLPPDLEVPFVNIWHMKILGAFLPYYTLPTFKYIKSLIEKSPSMAS